MSDHSNHLQRLVDSLPEVYQPIFGHPEMSIVVSRSSVERADRVCQAVSAYSKMLGRSVRILDLGCAQGFFTFTLASHGHYVHGVDYLKENIDVCECLKVESGLSNVSFEFADIADTIESTNISDYDVVLGLSVFHHLFFSFGKERTHDLLRRLSSKVEGAIFEIATREEGPYWSSSQPEEYHEFLKAYAFNHVMGVYDTHLSDVQRPLCWASNSIWLFENIAGRFDQWSASSNPHAPGVHQGSRRFFFGQELFVKVYDLLNRDTREANLVEWRREIAFLREFGDGVVSPKIVTFGASAAQAWLVRRLIDGVPLEERIRHIDAPGRQKVILQVLDALVWLEENDRYHTDIRIWNCLINDEGVVKIIDYGAISEKKEDCAWPYDLFLSFIIFMREILSDDSLNPYPIRSALLQYDDLPEPLRRGVDRIFRKDGTWSFHELREAIQCSSAEQSNDTSAEPEPDTISIVWFRRLVEALDAARSEYEQALQGTSPHAEHVGRHAAHLESKLQAVVAEVEHLAADRQRVSQEAEASLQQLAAFQNAASAWERASLALTAELAEKTMRIHELQHAAVELGRWGSDGALAPGRASSLDWLVRGTSAWLLLKAGSRPRRVAGRLARASVGYLRDKPRARAAAIRLTALVPSLQALLFRLAAEQPAGMPEFDLLAGREWYLEPEPAMQAKWEALLGDRPATRKADC
ncbi:methyltransferase domain-containing protein [Aurantimonas manganoxydans]|nr:methyltransferase domain-containing protein [Aurantimonas manganoxydans]